MNERTDVESWEQYAKRLECRIKEQRDHIISLQELRKPGDKVARKKLETTERALGKMTRRWQNEVDNRDALLNDRDRLAAELAEAERYATLDPGIDWPSDRNDSAVDAILAAFDDERDSAVRQAATLRAALPEDTPELRHWLGSQDVIGTKTTAQIARFVHTGLHARAALAAADSEATTCSTCGATPETGLTRDCPECWGAS